MKVHCMCCDPSVTVEAQLAAKADACFCNIFDIGHAERYRIRLQEVTCGPPFGRAVYMRCCTDSGTMQAGMLACQAFGHPAESRYIPHLTMLYSRPPMEAVHEVATREHQCAFTGHNRLPADGVDVDSICVRLTREDDPILQSWRLIKEFQLTA